MEWKTPGPRVGIKAAASRPPGLRFSDAREDAIFAIHFLIENIKQDLLVYEMQFRLVGSVWRIFFSPCWQLPGKAFPARVVVTVGEEIVDFNDTFVFFLWC